MRSHRTDREHFMDYTSRNLQVIVFDCDGVLFDSKEANVQFYNHVLGRFGYPPVRPDQTEYIHMHPVHASLGYLLGQGRDYQAALEYCMKMDFRAFNSYLRCEPGLVEFLQLIRSTYRIALATNRSISARDVLVCFELDQYFDLVVSAADVKFPKPHPESMEQILNTFEVKPDQVLFIGDSAVDESLAVATGVCFAAYKNPALKAHIHISHFRELHSIILPVQGR